MTNQIIKLGQLNITKQNHDILVKIQDNKVDVSPADVKEVTLDILANNTIQGKTFDKLNFLVSMFIGEWSEHEANSCLPLIRSLLQMTNIKDNSYSIAVGYMKRFAIVLAQTQFLKPLMQPDEINALLLGYHAEDDTVKQIISEFFDIELIAKAIAK